MTEGSLSKQRALVVAQTRARLKNNEGSVLQWNRMDGSVELNGWFSRIEWMVQ